MLTIIKATEAHLDQIAPLLSSTGYWNFGLKYNEDHLDSQTFMRTFIAPAHLPFTAVAVEPENPEKILGVIVCCSTEEMKSIPDNGPKLNSTLIELFRNSFEFKIPESYHVSFLAVLKDARRQGIGKKLLEHAEKNAKALGIETLSLYTVNCQTDSILLYLHFGMMVVDVITVSEKIPFRYFLYMEKNTRLTAMRNYFETEDYQQLTIPELDSTSVT